MNQAQTRHIFVEVQNGRGRHGSFLQSFADILGRADTDNFGILWPAALALIEKYKLDAYLDNFEANQ